MNWIKISEQLPPKGLPVLVATDDIRCPYEIWSYEGIDDDGDSIWRMEDSGGVITENPLAWQPLPEPYDGNIWEYNRFTEIACRKLAEIGIVKTDGGAWEYAKSEK